VGELWRYWRCLSTVTKVTVCASVFPLAAHAANTRLEIRIRDWNRAGCAALSSASMVIRTGASSARSYVR
jgi:hypothetical protein